MSWNYKKLLRLNLQFFAEGAEGGAQSGDGASEASDSGKGISDDDIFLAEMEQKYGITDGVATAEAKAKVSTKGQSLKSKEEEGEVNEETDPEPPTENTAKTVEEEFDELIKGKFKDQYGKKVQSAIAERFKNQKETNAEVDKLRGAVSALAARYGLDSEDIDGVISAMDKDDELYEKEALRTNSTPEAIKERIKQARDTKSTKDEVERLRSELKDRDNRDKAREDAKRWATEAKDTVKKYQNFNLLEELKNKDFVKFLNDGMNVTQAFEHAHLDEILSAQMKAVEKRTTENVTRTVANNRGRIAEGARSPHASVPAQNRVDLRNMRDEDFEKIEKLVNSGVTVDSNYFLK